MNIKPKVRRQSLKVKTKYKNIVKGLLLNPKADIKTLMLNEGYSLNTAKNPGLITSNPDFISLLNKAGLTDEVLANKAKEGLEATKPLIYGQEVIDIPDHNAQHRYFESVLRVKGHLNPANQVNIQANDYKLIIESNADNT